jgi:predicted DNA-binding protein (UPF0251 family)
MNQSRATRVMAGIALAGVSAIAAVVSYLHGLEVVQAVGAPPPVSYLIPFLADLVILGASAAWVDASGKQQRVPPLTILTAAVGIGVTLAMNVAAGWHHGAGGRLVAGWPAVAFILALESLAGIVRRGRGGTTASPVAATYDQSEPLRLEDALSRLVEQSSQRQVAAQLGMSRDRLRKMIATPADVADMAALNGDGPHA